MAPPLRTTRERRGLPHRPAQASRALRDMSASFPPAGRPRTPPRQLLTRAAGQRALGMSSPGRRTRRPRRSPSTRVGPGVRAGASPALRPGTPFRSKATTAIAARTGSWARGRGRPRSHSARSRSRGRRGQRRAGRRVGARMARVSTSLKPHMDRTLLTSRNPPGNLILPPAVVWMRGTPRPAQLRPLWLGLAPPTHRLAVQQGRKRACQ